jgi:two-component system LytT family response regulator
LEAGKKSTNMNCIRVDDELYSAGFLELQLRKNCPEVQILAVCNDSQEGLEKIRELKPDLIFLDIEMPGINGFQLLEALDDQHFMLIFTTAYDKYAFRAFRYSALDYLLKPINAAELLTAIDKAKNRHYELKQQLDIFQQHIQYPNLHGKIALPNQHGYLIVEIDHIILVESQGNYSTVHIMDEKPLMITKAIGDVEEALMQAGFYRVHRKFLVNLQYVREYIKRDGGLLVMKNGQIVPIARSRKEEFGQLIARI